MPVAEVVSLVSRWLHIMAAATAVGRNDLCPAGGASRRRRPASEAREAFHTAARRRWSKIVMTAIAVLLLSGLYNFITIKHNYKW